MLHWAASESLGSYLRQINAVVRDVSRDAGCAAGVWDLERMFEPLEPHVYLEADNIHLHPEASLEAVRALLGAVSAGSRGTRGASRK